MLPCAMSSAAAINSETWFLRHRGSLPSGFFSVSGKSTVFPTEKDLVRSFRARSLSLHYVVSNLESNNKVDPRTQILKTNCSLASVCENVIIPGEGASGARNSRNEENPGRHGTNNIVIRYPLGTEAAIKAILECNTLVFVVDKRANKTEIKDTFEKMFKVRAKKVNTSIMPDGRKKAFVMLARDFNALDVAKMIKIL